MFQIKRKPYPAVTAIRRLMRKLRKVRDDIIQYLSLNHTRIPSQTKHASLPISLLDVVHIILQATFVQSCQRLSKLLSAHPRSRFFDVPWFVQNALELLDLCLQRPFLLFDGLYSGLLQHCWRW